MIDGTPMTFQQLGDNIRRCLTRANPFRIVFIHPETYSEVLRKPCEPGFHQWFIDGNPAYVVCDHSVAEGIVVPAQLDAQRGGQDE